MTAQMPHHLGGKDNTVLTHRHRGGRLKEVPPLTCCHLGEMLPTPRTNPRLDGDMVVTKDRLRLVKQKPPLEISLRRGGMPRQTAALLRTAGK